MLNIEFAYMSLPMSAFVRGHHLDLKRIIASNTFQDGVQRCRPTAGVSRWAERDRREREGPVGSTPLLGAADRTLLARFHRLQPRYKVVFLAVSQQLDFVVDDL